MMPFMTQPAVAPACYVPKGGIAQSQIFGEGRYLTRTPTVSGDTRKWSWAGWITPSPDGVFQTLLSAYADVNNFAFFQFNPAGHLVWYERYANTTYWGWSTKAVYRDTAPFHVVLEYDTAAATPVADRLRIFINGVRADVDNTFGRVYGDDWSGVVNRAVEHRIGRDVGSYTDNLNGLMASPAMVSGAIPGTAAWGEANIHGVWVPKPKDDIHAAIAAAGGFGANGFHLDFSDPLNPGKDVSGKGNHWTAVGFDATGKDSVASSPTNRYATLNPLCNSVTISDGGLRMRSATAYQVAWSTLAGRRARMQATVTAGAATYHKMVAVSLLESQLATDAPTTGVSYSYDGRIVTTSGGAIVQTLTGYHPLGVGDVVDVYLDDAAGTVFFRVNDVLQATVLLPTSGRWRMGVAGHPAYSEWAVNFGQRPWTYAGLSDFPGLCTDNLPEPDIKDPGEAFVQVATTGLHLDAGLRDATAHWSSGGWVEIIKRLDADESWRWRFSDDPAKSVASDTQAAKGVAAALVSGANYVGLRLRIGQRYGVYTAEVNHVTGIATTVTHGLATLRSMVLVKRTDAASDWLQWHPDLPAGNLLTFNSNVAAAPNTGITGIGGNSFQIGAAMPSGIYRVLVLAERPGFIALGKYGGGTTYPFVVSDVAPLLFCQKRISGVGEHRIWLDATASGNPKPCLDINNAGVLDGTYSTDLDCGGARPNTTVIEIGAEGETYVHLQIGRPVGGVCVAPATAR